MNKLTNASIQERHSRKLQNALIQRQKRAYSQIISSCNNLSNLMEEYSEEEHKPAIKDIIQNSRNYLISRIRDVTIERIKELHPTPIKKLKSKEEEASVLIQQAAEQISQPATKLENMLPSKNNYPDPLDNSDRSE